MAALKWVFFADEQEKIEIKETIPDQHCHVCRARVLVLFLCVELFLRFFCLGCFDVIK